MTPSSWPPWLKKNAPVGGVASQKLSTPLAGWLAASQQGDGRASSPICTTKDIAQGRCRQRGIPIQRGLITMDDTEIVLHQPHQLRDVPTVLTVANLMSREVPAVTADAPLYRLFALLAPAL